MVLEEETGLLKGRNARTQYIVIPADMVANSQYPFKAGEMVRITIGPYRKMMIIRSVEEPALKVSPKGIYIKGKRLLKNEGKTLLQGGGITIYNTNILDIDAIKPDSVALIVTSPLYDVDIKYGVYRGNIPYGAYLEFTEKWLRRCYGFAKDDGRLCLNIPLDKSRGRNEEGFQSVYADITVIAKEVG